MLKNTIDHPENSKALFSNPAESIIISFAVVGAMFKIMHWPGANIIILLTLSALALVYFPFGFYFLGNPEVKKPAILSGFVMSLIPVGILFKVMHWPGAGVLLVSAAAAAPVLVLMLVWMRKKASPNTVQWYNSMLLRTVVVNALLFIMMLVRMH
jgi:hypothetical protein